MVKNALLLFLGGLLLGGCGLPAKRGIAWSWPDNLSELDTYWFAFDPDSPVDAPYECGTGRIARYCPELSELPRELRLRLQARRVLHGVGGFGGAASLESLAHAGERAYFLGDDESLYAIDAQSGGVLWAVEAPLGYDCRGALVLAGERIFLTCRHNLGRDYSAFAFDVASGEALGSAALDEPPSATFASGPNLGLLLVDGSLWNWSVEEGPELVRELPDRFRPLFEALAGKVSEPAAVAVLENALYLGGTTHLWSLARDGSAERWRAGLPGKARAVLPAEGRIIVLTSDGQALSFDPSDGKELSRVDADELDVNWYLATVGRSLEWELLSVTEAQSGQIVSCDFRGICIGLNQSASQFVWAGRVADRLRRNRPYVVGDKLLVETPDGNLIVVPGLPLTSNPAPSN